MKLDKEFLASEAELANLCPRKRVDFRLILEDEDSHVSDGKLQCNALVVLQQINHGVTGHSFAAIKMKRRRAILLHNSCYSYKRDASTRQRKVHSVETPTDQANF